MMEEPKQDALAVASAFILKALETAIASYQILEQAQTAAHDNPAMFKEFHDACKVAVGHINLLIEAWRKTQNKGRGRSEEPDQAEATRLIEAGRAEIERYEQGLGAAD